ncbi:MAG TPA: UvrB/UvrC motif-containing protein, partial [Candidatus Paceibacterota bacterium]|nr:UvrB/UvrC motif-containing protein [Candidatus Paceibacterota bacterium]
LDRKAYGADPAKLIALKTKQMTQAVKILDFETAAILRDEIRILEGSAPKAKAGPKKPKSLR